jgi:hypothetical protein
LNLRSFDLLQALLKGADVYGDPAAVKSLVEGKGEQCTSQQQQQQQQQPP